MDESSKKGRPENKREVRFWKYDDGSYGMVVIEIRNQHQWLLKKKQYINCDVFKTKDKLKAEMEKIQSQCDSDGYEFGKKKVKIKNGLKYISKKDFFREDERTEIAKENGWKELEKFLDSCGDKEKNKREVLRLFSGVLSGYCAQMAVPLIEKKNYTVPLQDRAPVLVLNAGDKRFNAAFDFISKAMCALAVPTDTEDKLRFYCPVFLPETFEEKTLDQGAFGWYRKKKNRVPAQYRNTAVLVFGNFFSVNKIRRFIERNRWATVVLFNAPSKTNNAPTIRLKDSLLDCKDFTWSAGQIHCLMEGFVLSLSKLAKKKNVNKKLKKRVNEIARCLYWYYAQKGVQRFDPTEEYFIVLQLLSLELFLDSCKDNEILDPAQRKQVHDEWFNCLLPGCKKVLQPKKKTISQELEAEEQTAKQSLQTALTEMLTVDQLIHFPYAEQNGSYEEANPENPSVTYWGYLRWYKPKKNEKTPFRALVFKESKFKEIVPGFLKKPCNVDDFVKDLRSCNLEYLFSTSKARLGGKTAENALIFIIDKMDFLSEEIRAMIAGKIPDQE